MKKHILKKLTAFIIIVIVFSSCVTTLLDISPNSKNGVSNAGNSTAGLIINMAGDSRDGLYAIGLNSGVWKTNTYNKWSQLPQSPRYAHCIAVDPNFPDHIAVGERDGDGIFTAQNNCGLWESYDGGKTFEQKYYFNPLMGPCRQDNRTQVVNGVVITNKSTTLITTPCGIGRKGYFEPTFTYPNITYSIEDLPFTSIAVFKDWIVARTKSTIYISNDDGKSWEHHVIQLNFKDQKFTQDYEEARGGKYSVAIVQLPQSNDVFVYVPVTRNPNDPGNYGSCLIFNNQGKYWNYQIIKQAGLGLAVGGRVFMKSFLSRNQRLEDAVGGNTNLIYCATEDIVKAKQINTDGTVIWESIAHVPGTSNFHTDIWDFLIDPFGSYAWVSGDGGVFNYALNNKEATISLNANNQYVNQNDGLHTQHIHEAFVTANLQGMERYGYATTDNDAWKREALLNGNLSWSDIGGMGDANWVAGDQGNPRLMLAARHFKNAVLTGLQDVGTIAGAKLGPLTINNAKANSFQFIQTLTNENPPPLLDAVMLTTLPLQYEKDKVLINVPNDLGQKSGTAIIRNPAFAANPDINLSMGVGWQIEFNDLPKGTQAFWVSGGHIDPTYYLLCNQLDTTVLYKRKKSESSWTKLTGLDKVEIISYAAGQVQHGPVFVNPYDPTVIYVSCKDGIYHSFNAIGGVLFEKVTLLTNLVSGNGKYPIDRTFSGSNDIHVSHANQSVLNAMYPLSWISFNRYNSKQVVASSPFTGVFFKDGSKSWKDFSYLLPKPFTPISSVNINNHGIYITTEGRGMFLILNN